jgi:hypothetical protein
MGTSIWSSASVIAMSNASVMLANQPIRTA